MRSFWLLNIIKMSYEMGQTGLQNCVNKRPLMILNLFKNLKLKHFIKSNFSNKKKIVKYRSKIISNAERRSQ